MNNLSVSFLPLMLLIAFFGNSAFPQDAACTLKPVSSPIEGDSKVRSPFRYLIVAGVSRIEKYVNENKELLSLEVLMEDKAFNEDNLKCLFRFLSDRFTERPGLMVNVYTSLDAMDTPEENDHRDLKGSISKIYKYKHAVYNRKTVPGLRNCNSRTKT